jgi:HCOMODA/2-hydroxy-3-carboxy-muconic semialdehyde decarboxylase
MNKRDAAINEVVTANRILAREGIVDSFGHPSIRHPDRADRFLMSRARAPELVEPDDIMEFTLEGEPVDAKGRKPYLERFIHGAILEARPDINAVVHNHSASVIPFGITKKKLKPLLHMCASMGHEVPVWDCHDEFGDTDLLVSDVAMGRSLAKLLGKGRAALMRGHGAVTAGSDIRQAVYIAYYMEMGAKIQINAMQMGDVTFLTPGEVDTIIERTGPYSINRAWESWCRRAGREMLQREGENAVEKRV